jgi:hypothetical protein
MVPSAGKPQSCIAWETVGAKQANQTTKTVIHRVKT